MPIKLYNAGEDIREKASKEAEKVFIVLAEAYVLGKKILDVKYKNAIVITMQAAIKSSGGHLGINSVQIICNGTPSTSPLRRSIVDSVACRSYDGSEEKVGWMVYFDGYPRGALVDAMKATVKARSKPGSETYPCIDSYTEGEEEGSDNHVAL